MNFSKAYFLDGICIFLAISPIIALISYMKKGYWIALVITEFYSFIGLFTSTSNTLKALYPITAVFTISGYYEASTFQVMLSCISLLFCVGLAAVTLAGMNKCK